MVAIPDVIFRAMEGFLGLDSLRLRGGFRSSGLFLHLFVAPASRRFPGIRHPALDRFGPYLFLPFGLVPSPGWTDRCAKRVIRIVICVRFSSRRVDSVGELPLVA